MWSRVPADGVDQAASQGSRAGQQHSSRRTSRQRYVAGEIRLAAGDLNSDRGPPGKNSFSVRIANDLSLPPVVHFSGNEAGVYRFFDMTKGTQFITSDVAERNSIINTRPDLSYEGLGMGAVQSSNGDPNALPVYRFFNSAFGTHFFTTSASEAASVSATRPDLKQESSTIFEHSTQQAGDVAVYRFFDSNNGTHFYTNSESEKASLIQTRHDMVSEGIAFYAPKI